jgi:hypothetical protein
VSVEAISWALNLAPVPADRGGQPCTACTFVLVGLANHVGPDGTGAFPSVATLIRYTGLSERTVRTCLDRLEAAGIVSPCDPGIVAARIKRADRRPQGWNLNLSLVRDDLDDAAIAVLEHQFPGLGIRLATAAPPGTDGQSDAVQSPHPGFGNSEAVDNRPNGVQQLHPEPGTGRNHRIDGVQQGHEQGAAVAPKPSKEPSMEPSAASAHARQVPATAGTASGDLAVGEFFAVLDDGWRLTADQRARLAPAVQAALTHPDSDRGLQAHVRSRGRAAPRIGRAQTRHPRWRLMPGGGHFAPPGAATARSPRHRGILRHPRPSGVSGLRIVTATAAR